MYVLFEVISYILFFNSAFKALSKLDSVPPLAVSIVVPSAKLTLLTYILFHLLVSAPKFFSVIPILSVCTDNSAIPPSFAICLKAVNFSFGGVSLVLPFDK